MRILNYLMQSKKAYVFLFSLLLISSMSGCACQHEWGNWQANGDDMKRSCSNCHDTEIKPLDWDMLIDQFFIGSWHAVSICESETFTELFAPDEREFKETQCVFSADNTCSINLLGSPVVGNWTAVPRMEAFPSTFGIIVDLEGYGDKLIFYSSDPDTDRFVLELPGKEALFYVFFERTNN